LPCRRFFNPDLKRSMRAQGVRRPVSSSVAEAPRCRMADSIGRSLEAGVAAGPDRAPEMTRRSPLGSIVLALAHSAETSIYHPGRC
jgi:hypothetical protein